MATENAVSATERGVGEGTSAEDGAGGLGGGLSNPTELESYQLAREPECGEDREDERPQSDNGLETILDQLTSEATSRGR